jgi:PmbA protein
MNDILDLGLELIRGTGAEGEIYLEHSAATMIGVLNGRVESLVQRATEGAGIRIFSEGRTAFAFTADLSPEGIARAITSAGAIAPHTKRDEANLLPPAAAAPTGSENRDPGLARIPIAEKMEIARAVERAARAESPAITKVREASYQEFDAVVAIANTRGERTGYDASRCYAGIELAASATEGAQTGSCVGWSLGPRGLDPEGVGREAARRAVRKLGARQPATGRMSVVLDPEAAAGLFGALAVLNGRSLLAGRIGSEVASPCVDLIDDGRISGGFSSAPIDGEGTPTGETVLIRAGRLEGYFHTVFTARRMGVAPTGNGVRGGYGGTPEPSPTNLYLRPTGQTREALLAAAGRGVYVTDWMGLHTIDTITGEFSLGASGLAIEGGELREGLDRMAIAGNVLDLLSSVEAVADDLQFLVAGAGSTVLLRGISVGGA